MLIPELYPAQAEGVRRYLSLPQPRRFIFPWKTGCGKTASSLRILEGLTKQSPSPDDPLCKLTLYPRTLIVCPAVVRNHWYREVQKWLGQQVQDFTAEIIVGRTRKLQGKPANERREKAYAAHIQIVSYDLLCQVDADGWEFIILDEMHHIAHPQSKQSRMGRSLTRANENADILGLSATLIPTEGKQLWNPLRTIFGEKEWGSATRTGNICWEFRNRYCNPEITPFGVSHYGIKESTVKELRARLSHITYPLSREDIIKDLPSLDVKVQQFPTARTEAKLVEQITEWHNQFDPDDVRKKIILVRHRALAKAIYEELSENEDDNISYIDGTMTPEKRSSKLSAYPEEKFITLVGTHEALSEGIRLMWAQQVLIAETSQSPGRVCQLLGRFNSIGSQARPQVTIHATEDTFAASQTLLRRTEDIMSTLGESSAEQKVRDIFDNGDQAPIVKETDWLSMFDSAIPSDWGDDETECG